MMMTRYLSVTGALRGGGKERWFRLPDTGRASRSVRFGRHALVMEDTMRILPVGDVGRFDPEPSDAPAPGAARPAGAVSWCRRTLLSFLM